MKKIWNYITATRRAVGNILFIGIILFIIIAVTTRDDFEVPDSSVLVLHPDGVIVERKSIVDPFALFMNGGDNPYAEVLLRDIVDVVNFARDDERIKAIALDLSDLSGGSISQFDEIAVALQAFKETGKPISAFAGQYTQAQYYLASFADEVYLDKNDRPFPGGVFLQGIGIYNLYLKSALEKIHVQYHVFQAGQYKSAVEIFLRDEMSDQAREAADAWLQVVWNGYLATILEQREISADELTNYIDNYDKLLDEVDADPVGLATKYGLIDAQLSRAEWRQKINDTPEGSKSHKARISMDTYLNARRSEDQTAPAEGKIAIIVIDGALVDGEESLGNAGAETLVDIIQRAGKDSAIKAVVVRINSPGGVISASELIRSELAAVQQKGKPVVVSMGGVAASGGYWIASVADMIVASGTTVTGSIGVFSLALTLDQSLKALGIHPDGTGTTAFSSSYLWFMPIDPAVKNIIQNRTSKSYEDFVNLVADGRGLSYEEVDAVAQGRVWAGETALEHGLIDKIGTLKDALESAAMLADMEDYEAIYLEKILSPQEIFMMELIKNLDSAASLVGLRHATSNLPLLQKGLDRILPPAMRATGVPGMNKAPGIYAECLGCQINF